MKTLIIPDLHGSSIWKLLVNTETFDRVVFLGDYFDSVHFKTEEQVNNFLDIIEYKKKSGKEVIMLIGNHDFHYFPEIDYNTTSGFQEVGQYQISPVLTKHRKSLQMAYMFDNFLCTHAGVGQTFMNDCFGLDGWSVPNIADDLNELWMYKPLAFAFNGWEATGDNIGQTPIWIRPRSLMQDAKLIKAAGITQIVGHTQVKEIFKDKGLKYYLVDTLQQSMEYITIDGKEVKVNKL